MVSNKIQELEFVVFGINYTTAPIDLRDQVYFNPQEIKTQSTIWKQKFDFQEIIILSTCNRTEIYIYADPHQISSIAETWRQYKEISKTTFYEHLYIFKNKDTIQHLFKVCCALDSMVLGENQILNQVKVAYQQAVDNGCTQQTFNQIFQKAFFVGKKIRSETELGKGVLSIASVAVELIKKVDGNQTAKKRIAIIGVGEMCNIICSQLKKMNCSSFDFYNRTISNTQTLINTFSGRSFSLEELPKNIHLYDIVISATASPNFILTKKQLQINTPKKNILLLIDIATPRDIDPSCSDFSNILLFSIDDLKQIVTHNQSSRQKEAIKAIIILEKEVKSLHHDLKLLPINDIVQDLQKELNHSAQSILLEFQNTYPKEDFIVVEKKVLSLSQKLKHQSILEIKKRYTNSSELDLKEVINKHKQNLSQHLKSLS